MGQTRDGRRGRRGVLRSDQFRRGGSPLDATLVRNEAVWFRFIPRWALLRAIGGVTLFAAIPFALDHPRREAASGPALPPRSDEGRPHGEEARAREGALGRPG
jgi:hypothetical protein